MMIERMFPLRVMATTSMSTLQAHPYCFLHIRLGLQSWACSPTSVAVLTSVRCNQFLETLFICRLLDMATRGNYVLILLLTFVIPSFLYPVHILACVLPFSICHLPILASDLYLFPRHYVQVWPNSVKPDYIPWNLKAGRTLPKYGDDLHHSNDIIELTSHYHTHSVLFSILLQGLWERFVPAVNL